MFYYLLLLTKYILLFYYFYFIGRGVVLLINTLNKNNQKITENILFVKKEIYYPIIGIALFGNILIVFHYFVELKNPFILVISIILLLLNSINLSIFKLPSINFHTIIYYLVIPSILIISSYDTTWHYDAGYYHLNHQNLLRESNMIIGTVNIFWAFGMSSIFEYISAFLWFDKSFILIHFLTLIFIQTFYIFLMSNLENFKYKELSFASYFILIYSLLDNFGVNGGRNGYIYIQGVTAQDIPIAILVFMMSFSCFLIIRYRKTDNLDIFILFLLSLFVIQIKLSSIVFGYLLVVTLFFINKVKLKSFREIVFSFMPILPFLIAWLAKGYLTTGCFLFPLSVTCINNFEWYLENSTKSMENITTNSSIGFIEYFYQSKQFSEWWHIFISSKINMTVVVNFLVSFLVIYMFKKIIFKPRVPKKFLLFSVISYFSLYFGYLFLYGPTPRYAIGIFILLIASIAFFVEEYKFKIKTKPLFFLYIFSLILLIRLSSYEAFFLGSKVAIFDPIPITKYQEFKEGWFKPDEGDQCWINILCTMENQPAVLKSKKFFTTAFKNI